MLVPRRLVRLPQMHRVRIHHKQRTHLEDVNRLLPKLLPCPTVGRTDIALSEKARMPILVLLALGIASGMNRLPRLKTRWVARHASATAGLALLVAPRVVNNANRMEGWPSSKKKVVSPRNLHMSILIVTRNDVAKK